MIEESWMIADRREALWDQKMQRRPVCDECGRPILGRYLRIGEISLCQRCIRLNMVEE